MWWRSPSGSERRLHHYTRIVEHQRNQERDPCSVGIFRRSGQRNHRARTGRPARDNGRPGFLNFSQIMSTPSPIAFLFPGQGSQAVGMGKELAANYPVARQTFEEADEALRYKLSQLCFEGPEEKLKLTEITQPAILTTSIAAWRVLQEKNLKPDFLADYVAGRSLGEYSAHVAAGTLKFADAVKTVRNRGKYMQEAVPVGVGAMAAILGMTLNQVTEICRDAARGEVCQPANLNSPEQVVIS